MNDFQGTKKCWMFYVKGFHLRRVTVWNLCTLQHQVQQEVILEALEPAAVSSYQPCVVTCESVSGISANIVGIC